MRIWEAKFTVTGPDTYGEDFCNAIQKVIEEHPEYTVEYIESCKAVDE